jgi:CubicO group peptidase (beta-lactamase class C family)
MTASKDFSIQGQVSRGFEVVREAFAGNFVRRHELGGACSTYYRGEKVVDLWGGVRNKETGEAWEENTMVVIHSATKGLAAMTLAIAHSRGWLDYEERVAAYWPEFAQQGKDRITVRQLLAHQGGLFAIEERVDRSIVADLDRLAVVLARQNRHGSPEPGRHITRSASGSMKASCCGVSIRATAPSDSSSKRRSRCHLGWTFISGCLRRS